MELAEAVYMAIESLPSTEKYALSSQLQRAAISIPANIAEGYGRLHRGDYLHHLSIARGSLCEIETLLTLAVRLGKLNRHFAMKPWKLAQETGQMLHRLIRALTITPARPGTQDPEPGTR
jgi:four helix bundle protein